MKSTVLLLVSMLIQIAVAGGSPSAPVQLANTRIVPAPPGSRSALGFEWDAVPGETYRVQRTGTLGEGFAWDTIGLVTAAGDRAVFVDPLPLGGSAFYQIRVPELEIHRIEPSIIGTGASATVHVVGECFGSGDTLRVNGTDLPTLWIGPRLLQVTAGPLSAGFHGIELVRDGLVLLNRAAALEVTEAPGIHLFEPPASTRFAWWEHGNAPGVTAAGTKKDYEQWVNKATGEFRFAAEDLRIPGRGMDFVWRRTYRSRTGRDNGIGINWDHSCNIRAQANGGEVVVYNGHGRCDAYLPQPGGTFRRDGFFAEGTIDPVTGEFALRFADGSVWNFHVWTGIAGGRIRRMADRHGNAFHFTYDDLGRLRSVFDTLDREIVAGYDGEGRIGTVTDFTGRVVRYGYDEEGDLRSVTLPAVSGTPTGNDFPEGKTTRYTYSQGRVDDRLNHNLLTIADAGGRMWLTNSYSAAVDPGDFQFDRLVRGSWGDANGHFDFWSTQVTPAPQNRFATIKTIVNDPAGNVEETWYDSRNHKLIHRDLAGRALADLPTSDTENRPVGKLRSTDPDFFETQYQYNADSLCTRILRPEGDILERVYQRDLDRSTSPLVKGNLRLWRQLRGPREAAQEEIVTYYEHDPRFGSEGGARFATLVSDGRRQVSRSTYDAAGNLIHIRHRDPGIEEDFEYNAFGQLTSRTHPDNGSGHRRIDSYEYHESGVQRGYLRHIIEDSFAGGHSLRTTWDCDALGNVTSVTDPRGNDTRYVYNQLDQVVRELSRPVSLPGGQTIRYERNFYYDANNNLARVCVLNAGADGVVDPANSHLTTLYEYGLLDQPGRVTREAGRFDVPLSPPQLTSAGLPAGEFLVTEYEYDANRNPARVRHSKAVDGSDPFDTVTTLYDERDLVFQVVRAQGSPDQSTVQHDYNRNGHLEVEWEGLENEPRLTRYSRDGYDRCVRVTDAAGNTGTYAYDANGNLVHRRIDGATSDGFGPVQTRRLWESSTEYDAMDRGIHEVAALFDVLTQQPLGAGVAESWRVWSPNSQLLESTDDNHHTRRHAYDRANRLSTVTDAAGNTLTYSYDRNGNVTNVLEGAQSGVTSFVEAFHVDHEYDALDRRILTRDNVGNTSGRAWDSRDNLVRSIDAAGVVTEYRYDGINRLIRTGIDMDGDGDSEDPGDIVTVNIQDGDRNLRVQVDGNGNGTTNLYDSLHRLTGHRYADGTGCDYTYDVHDNVVLRVDANGSVITDTHDSLNRLIDRAVVPGPGVAGDTTFERYRYDGLNRLVGAEDDDASAGFVWDSFAGVLRETVNGQTAQSVYDGEGNRLTLIYPGGREVYFTHDALNRVQTVSSAAASGGGALALATYRYSGTDRMVRRENGNGSRSRYNYDGASTDVNQPGDFGWKKIWRIRHALPGANPIIDERLFTWDRRQSKTSRLLIAPLESPDQAVLDTYEYDAADRLTGSTTGVGGVAVREWVQNLDAVGNRTGLIDDGRVETYFMDPAVPVPADRQMNQYTMAGARSQSHDDNGNVVLSGGGNSTTALVYDYRNQLVALQNPPGTAPRVRYSYDPLGRRIGITENPGSEEPRSTLLFYSGSGLIEQQEPGQDPVSYVIPEVDDEVLVMFRQGRTYFYHCDDLGSTLALTDEMGGVVERYEYGVFGLPLFLDPDGHPQVDEAGLPVASSSVGNPFLFQGLYRGSESPLYHDKGVGGENPLHERRALVANPFPLPALGQMTKSPMYKETRMKGQNPLYEETSREGENPLYNATVKEVQNPLAAAARVGGPPGGGYYNPVTGSYLSRRGDRIWGDSSSGGNPRTFAANNPSSRVVVRGWDPKKKEEIVGGLMQGNAPRQFSVAMRDQYCSHP